MTNIEQRVNKLDRTLARIGGIVVATAAFALVFLGYQWFRIPNLVIEEMNKLRVAQKFSELKDQAEESLETAKRATKRVIGLESEVGQVALRQKETLARIFHQGGGVGPQLVI